MRALFVAVNTFVLGMLLGAAALYIGALATGTVVERANLQNPRVRC